MKFIHLSDLHFNQQWFNWIKTQEDNYDFFCITGDFLDTSLSISLEEQITWVSNWMRTFNKPLFVCSGNHDDIDDPEHGNWLASISNIYSDNAKRNLNGIKVGCMPWGCMDMMEFDDCDILLNHVPPAKTKVAIAKNNADNDKTDLELFRLLAQGYLAPKYLLCGHIHDPLSPTIQIKKMIISNPSSGKNLEIPMFFSADI